jgi:uncharacterized protein (TIGR03067 family)
MGFQMLLAVSACALLAGDEPGADMIQQEWKKLEGTWTVIKAELAGKSLLEKNKPLPKVTIKGGKVTTVAKDVLEHAPIKLNPSQKPKTIMIPNLHGGDPQKGITLIGIYELKADELKVCSQVVETARLKERERERPKAFDSEQGILVIFKREAK